MNKYNKHFFLYFLLLLNSNCCKCQTTSIIGQLKFDYSWRKYYPVKVIIKNDIFSDTTEIDTNFMYNLEKIPYGVYQLKIMPNYGVTGLKSLIITDLVLNEPIVEMYPVTLSKGTVCESGQSFIYGKKSNKEFYATGELYAEGEFKIDKEYVPKFKKRLYSYQKQGLWKYYYKSGNLLKNIWFEEGNMVRIEEFYESGSQKISGYYNGCKDKEWIYFSENGEVVFKVFYNNPFLNTVPSLYIANYMENLEVIEN